MFELIACSSPLKLVLLVALLSFMLGALVGAWWESRPLSDLEKRKVTGEQDKSTVDVEFDFNPSIRGDNWDSSAAGDLASIILESLQDLNNNPLKTPATGE